MVEFLFVCSVPEDYTPRNGDHPDRHQVAVVWAGMAGLADMPLYPRSLAGFLAGLHDRLGPTYLGRIDW